MRGNHDSEIAFLKLRRDVYDVVDCASFAAAHVLVDDAMDRAGIAPELIRVAYALVDGVIRSSESKPEGDAAVAEIKPITFEEAWKRMEAKGYQYGPGALEQVRLGWELRQMVDAEDQ